MMADWRVVSADLMAAVIRTVIVVGICVLAELAIALALALLLMVPSGLPLRVTDLRT